MYWFLIPLVFLLACFADVLVSDSSGGISANEGVNIPLLIQHIINNDIGSAYDLIAMGEDPNVREIPSGWTPLIYAANSGNVELSRHLIMAGANVNTGCADGWTPLMFASVRGKLEIIQLLLEQGSNIYQTSFNGATALGCAHLGGFDHAIKLIEDSLHDSKLNEIFRDKNGIEAVLLSAAHDGNAPLVEKLLKNGHDPNTISMGGWTPLMLAAAADCVPCIPPLIEAGANVNAQDHDGWTALMFCAHAGNTECAQLLVESSADIMITNSDNYNSLHLSHAEGNVKTFHAIVGVSFCAAIRNGDVERMMAMIRDGVDPNYVCASVANYTPLIVAVKAQDEAAVSELLADERINVNAVEHDHWSALMFASLRDNENIIRLLLQKGADREILTKQGYSVIRLAQMFNKNNDVVLGMLENGLEFTDSPSVYEGKKNQDENVVEVDTIRKIADAELERKGWRSYFTEKKYDLENNEINHYPNNQRKGLLSNLFGWAA